MFKFAFDAIGTPWEIDTPQPLAVSLRQAVLERIARFDASYSRFRADSLVARITAATDGGPFEFPDDAPPLFDLYDRLYAATSDAVDPLVGRNRHRHQRRRVDRGCHAVLGEVHHGRQHAIANDDREACAI